MTFSPASARQTLGLFLSERMENLAWDSFSPAEWDVLIRNAQAEGVAPLLYWRLSRSGRISSFPDSVHAMLRAAYSSVWMHNQKIFKELESLLPLFDQAGIPVVILKGACFALTVYADVGLRPMGDLDLLVPEDKLPQAVRIAKGLGYADLIPEASPGLRELLNHEISLQKTQDKSISLELHKSLVADKSFVYAAPVDWFWNQTEALDCTSSRKFGNLKMLTPTAQILYATAHAMLQHGGKNSPLPWFYDLDRLIVHYSQRVDWDLLLSQARVFEWTSALEAALSRIIEYFNTPIPGAVRVALSEYSDKHRKLVALLQQRPATHVLEESQKLKALNGYGKLRLVLALLAPSPAYMQWRYQLGTVWLLPAYYLLRWWGILIDSGRTLISFFR